MERWIILGLITLAVAELLCCAWNCFFQWYKRKRESETCDFLDELQRCTVQKPVTVDTLEEKGDAMDL